MLLRLLDANLNRLAEALRVAEDCCRLGWDLAALAAELKSIRHAVFAAVEAADLPRAASVQARDIAGDVGRRAASPDAGDLEVEDLAARNLQRAKESLRVIEETVRALAPGGERALETLAATLVRESPEVYFEIQADNPYSHEAVERLEQALGRLKDLIAGRDAEGFAAWMRAAAERLPTPSAS